MSQYEEIIPSLPLREYIECYWILISDSSLKNELCLPDGSVSLVFNFGPDYDRAMCHQPNERTTIGRFSMMHQGKSSVLITQESPVRLLGVRFKPYGMAPFFQVSMTDHSPPFLVHGQPLHLLLGTLKYKLWEASLFEERIEILEEHFIKKIPKLRSPDALVKQAVSIMVKNLGNLKITELLETLCVSKSNLEKKFQEHVGLSPKIMCNILRFNSLIYSHQQDPSPSLTELTYSQGFFDQSHLVHNFRSFTGLPPGKFFRQENRLIEMLRQSFESRTLDIY